MRHEAWLTLAIALTCVAPGWAQDAVEQTGTAASGSIKPTPVPDIRLEESPPVVTDAQRRALERALERTHRPGPPLPEAAPSGGPEPTPGAPTTPRPLDDGSGPRSFAPGAFVVTTLPLGAAAPSNFKSVVNEPTADGYGGLVVQSGNWYLAVSTNGGASFGFVSPFTLVNGVDDGFCCDQVVTYDRGRDMLFIVLMTISSGTTQRNTLRLYAVSGVRAGTQSTFVYDFTPQGMGYPANRWFDFPKLVVGRNHLYLTANVFRPAVCGDPNPPCVFDSSVIARLPLDPMRDGAGLNFDFASSPVFNFTVAEGIGHVAYWGAHLTTGSLRIYSWADHSPNFSFVDRAVPTWSDATRSCPGPDGRDWCGRGDGRILGAYLRDRPDGVDGKELGFMWSSNRQVSAGRPMPYVRVARFAVNGWTLIDVPDLFSDTIAWIYPYAAPNAAGGLGVSVFFGGGPSFPSLAVCISDDLAPAPPWTCATTLVSTQGPTSNRWGDYVSVRTHWPRANTWRATGYRLVGGGIGENVGPAYIEFGRGRDVP